MPEKAQGQLGLDEKVIDDKDLAAALEERQTAREKLGLARSAFKKLHDEVKARIERLDLGIDTAVRVGRFRITKTAVAARHVEFDADETDRVSIKLAGEE